VSTVEYLASQLPCRATTIPKEKLQGKAAQRLGLTDEARRLAKFDHPNTLRLLELLQDQDHFYAVFEGCPGGCLLDFLYDSRLKKPQLLAMLVFELLSGLAYVHSLGEVHGRMSPGHVLLMAGLGEGLLHVKIAGFGELDAVMPSDKLLGERFTSPEGAKKPEADIWSLGLLMYTILAGKCPYAGETEKALAAAKQVPINLSLLRHKDTQLLDFITQCLHSPPTALQLRTHPWLRAHLQRPVPSVYASVLQQLRSYSPSNPLRDAILHFILYRLASERQYVEVAGVFEYLNPGTGKLEMEDLISAYAKTQPEKQAVATAQQVLLSLDQNDSESVSYSEFLIAGIGPSVLLSAENIRRAFKCFDRNGNGEVSLEEFKHVLTVKSGASADRKWRELLLLADRTGDGEVDLREFTQLLLEQGT